MHTIHTALCTYTVHILELIETYIFHALPFEYSPLTEEPKRAAINKPPIENYKLITM